MKNTKMEDTGHSLVSADNLNLLVLVVHQVLEWLCQVWEERMVPSPQDGPQLSSLVIYSCSIVSSHIASGAAHVTNRSDGVWILRWGHKRHRFHLVFSWVAHSEGSWLPRHEDTQTFLWKDLCGVKQAFASSQHQLWATSVNHLGSKFSSPSQAFIWLQL